MTDLEYDVLDELYFVQSFDYLEGEIEIKRQELIQVLVSLYQKDWIKCFIDRKQEVSEKDVDIPNNHQQYYYLATKKGLMAHNVGE